MRTYRLEHLSDTDLLRDLRALVARERVTTAAVLAHIAEVDARRLYLPAGFPSMFEYSVQELRLSEQAAMKRIRAGRTARRFPAIFEAVADGRLHLSAIVLLTPHLTPDNAVELLAAAAYQTRAELELLLARRFPRPDLPARIEAVSPAPRLTSEGAQVSPGTVETASAQVSPGTVGGLAHADPPAPVQIETPVSRPRMKPLSAESFAVQFTIGRATHDKLRHVQELMSNALPSGDIAQVFDRALDALAEKLEKRKFAATARPRARSRRSAGNPRYIPAHVRRAVWKRDGGRCTFVSATGHRCSARKFLEWDHIEPVARGGQAVVANVRLRCRAHNQLEADRAFGAGFMNGKRAGTHRTAAKAHTDAARDVGDLKTALRELGFRAGEARRAIEFCETLPGATLEEQVRAALRLLCPKARVHAPVGPTPLTAP